MALFQLSSSVPFSFTKSLPLERKSSSFLATKSACVICPVQCRASNNVSNDNQTVQRPSEYFQPTVWHYDYIQSLESDYKKESYIKQSEVLREEVRMMLNKVEDQHDQLELIDILQRLGVAYHFNEEIRNILDNIYNMDTSKGKNLHDTALKFRLLRQHGYDISTDVFDIFQDGTGYFKKCLLFDIEGILSLYEASFHSLEDETILDEARDFTLEVLKQYVNNNDRDDYMSLLISHALELPLHWRVPRFEIPWFVDAYEKKHNINLALLHFAKLDFNSLQAIHQEELKNVSRWWKELDTEKWSFGRDRLVENFFWGLGMDFMPDQGYVRSVITKAISLVTAIDDIYDVYGTIEELELFTKVIDRWDVNAIGNLPNCMKICFVALNKFVSEVAFETLKHNGDYVIPYLRKGWADLCKAFFVEAKWYHNGYTPCMEEYIENSWMSISAPVVLAHTYVSDPNSFKKEELFSTEEYPNLARLSGMLLRLPNDLVASKRKDETEEMPKAIVCYMNEARVSETQAREHVKSMMTATWKMMNKEVHNSSFSQRFMDIAMNFARVGIFLYRHGDGYTNQDPECNNDVLTSIMKPIPVRDS